MYLENELCKINIKIDKEYTLEFGDNTKDNIVHNLKKDYQDDISTTFIIDVELDNVYKHIVVIGDLCSCSTNCAILEGEKITILQDTFICQIRVTDGKLVSYIKFDSSESKFGIYKVKNSYLIYGELEITMLDTNLNKKWVFSGKDIFASRTDKKAFEICENCINLYDWQGNYYEIDFDGNIIRTISIEDKTEQLSKCRKNGLKHIAIIIIVILFMIWFIVLHKNNDIRKQNPDLENIKLKMQELGCEFKDEYKSYFGYDVLNEPTYNVTIHLSANYSFGIYEFEIEEGANKYYDLWTIDDENVLESQREENENTKYKKCERSMYNSTIYQIVIKNNNTVFLANIAWDDKDKLIAMLEECEYFK